MKSFLKPDSILRPNRRSATLKVLNKEALQPHQIKVMWNLLSIGLRPWLLAKEVQSWKIATLRREEIERQNEA